MLTWAGDAPLIETEMPKLAVWRDRIFARPSVVPVMTRLIAYLRADNRFVPPFMAAERQP
ncbi:MAG: hypothetical protein WDN06_06125 [Asticcacaulis sp.]